MENTHEMCRKKINYAKILSSRNLEEIWVEQFILPYAEIQVMLLKTREKNDEMPVDFWKGI